MHLLLALIGAAAYAQAPIRGFAPDQVKAQRELEEKARALPQSDRIRTYLKRMSSEPHHAGSAGSKAVADYAVGLFKEWGLDARLETFEALLPYPTRRLLEMTAPIKYRARLHETPLSEDDDSGDANQLPTFNAYSASGDVTAPILYVNYGLPEDYEHLERQGISAKGKIVIARYGRSWRGTKPKVAYEHGAVACLIYSDPREDGYFQGDTYPKGAFRPPQGVQRGSVMDMPLYVGDPLSPGWASEKGSKRLTRDEAKTLMKIPVLPISYEDATPLLKNLGGPVAPEPWRGALPFTYHIGPGPATARLKLDFDWSSKPVHDVIATIPGKDFPDQWIIYGNHHDAWVNGASDPLSGASSLLETGRVLAQLRNEGWQPRRTIVLALWDAEEFGLIGSTEWAEKHKQELDRKAVLYMNSDSNGKGWFNASGSHALEPFIAELLGELKDPVSGATLIESRRERRPAGGGREREPATGEFHLGSLGAGSDYVAFLDHVGVASLNVGFGGDGGGGVYHSIYDSFHWFSQFGDPDFKYGKALSEMTTTTLLRLSGAPILPFEFSALARTVARFVDEIQKEAGKDAKVDWRDLQTELSRLTAAAKVYEAEFQNASRRAGEASIAQLGQINQAIYRSERALTLARGLPGRDWYKHQLYAPGMYTGYAVKTLPGVREAAEAKHWEEATEQAHEVARVLRALNAEVTSATGLLKDLVR